MALSLEGRYNWTKHTVFCFRTRIVRYSIGPLILAIKIVDSAQNQLFLVSRVAFVIEPQLCRDGFTCAKANGWSKEKKVFIFGHRQPAPQIKLRANLILSEQRLCPGYDHSREKLGAATRAIGEAAD